MRSLGVGPYFTGMPLPFGPNLPVLFLWAQGFWWVIRPAPSLRAVLHRLVLLP